MRPPVRLLLLIGVVAGATACSDYEFGTSDVKDPEDTGDDLQIDVFTVEDSTGVDLVFFGDTSDSMQPELTLLGEHITYFVTEIAGFTTDWQMMAVTGPTGCGVGGIFTPGTPDYATAFAQAILTKPGEDLVDEWGLYDTAAAIELTDPGECNEGFLREDAPLQVIFFSDEFDSSPGYDTDPTTYWQQYLDMVRLKKGSEGLVVYSAVAGPVPDGCEGAIPGTGYAEAVDATGGEFLSICDAWYTQLDVLAASSIRQDTFVLSAEPVVSTLQVWVNDVERTDGWTYKSWNNAVVFRDHAPVSGDAVRARYEIVSTE